MARHVFISHSHEDVSRANALLEALEQRGVRCWIAPRDVTPGGSYAESILTGLEGSSCFVLIYSSASNKSRHVLREVERALVLGINIVPVRFDDAPVSKSLDYLLATVHWISVPSNDPAVMAGVAERIRACALAADPPPAAGSAAAAPPSAPTQTPVYHQAPIAAPAPPPTRSGSRERMLLAVCALLLLAVGGLAAFFVLQRTPSGVKAPETTVSAAPQAQTAPSAAAASAPAVAEAAVRQAVAAPVAQPEVPNAAAVRATGAADAPAPLASSRTGTTARWLIPDSNTRLLSVDELRRLSPDELWRARNEIYARRGLIFSSERGRQLTADVGPEYRGTETSQDVVEAKMSAVERRNVSLIKALEAGNVSLGTVRDPDGYTNVRAKPTTQSTIVGRASDGETVQLTGKTESWYSVMSLGPGFQGYVHESRIQLVR